MSSSPAFSRFDLTVEDREVQDDEQVARVLVDLRALVAREHVLEVERVEVELLREPGALDRRRALDVDPAQAGALDRPRPRAGARAAQRERRARHRGGGAAWAWEGSASLLVSLWARSSLRRTAYATVSALAGARIAIVPAHITAASRGVEGLARRSPGNHRRSQDRRKVPIPAGGEPGRCEWKSGSDLCSQQAEVFFVVESRKPEGASSEMAPTSLSCKECGTSYPLEARYVCEQCFGPLEVAYDHSGLDPAEAKRKIQAGPQGIWRYADFLPFGERPARPAAARPDAARARRPARRAARPRRGLGQERRRQPDPLVQGPRGRGRDREGARARLRDRRLCLDRQPRQRGRRPRRGRRARLLRLRPRRPRGAEAARDRRPRDPAGRRQGQLRRRQPALHRALRVAPVGVRERQPAPLLLGGLEDASATRSSSSSAGRCPTGSSARSPRARCSRASPRGSRSGATLGLVEGELPTFDGAQAAGCDPVAVAYREGDDVCRPQRPETIAKSLAIGNPADGPYAVELARRTGGSIESVDDEEIRAGIRLLAETTGVFTETAGGVTTAVLAKRAAAGAIAPGERRRRRDHRRRAEDPGRGSSRVRDRRDRPLAGLVRGHGPRRRAARPGGALSGR